MDEKLHDRLKEEILPEIGHKERQVRDSMDHRRIQCESCGLVELEEYFTSYGGRNHVNLGICKGCAGRETG